MMVLSVWCAPFLSQYYILPSTRETKEILEQKRKKEEKKAEEEVGKEGKIHMNGNSYFLSTQ